MWTGIFTCISSCHLGGIKGSVQHSVGGVGIDGGVGTFEDLSLPDIPNSTPRNSIAEAIIINFWKALGFTPLFSDDVLEISFIATT